MKSALKCIQTYDFDHFDKNHVILFYTNSLLVHYNIKNIKSKYLNYKNEIFFT